MSGQPHPPPDLQLNQTAQQAHADIARTYDHAIKAVRDHAARNTPAEEESHPPPRSHPGQPPPQRGKHDSGST